MTAEQVAKTTVADVILETRRLLLGKMVQDDFGALFEMFSDEETMSFYALGLPRVISLIRPENLPSRRVAEKNGMTVEKETVKSDYLHYVYALDALKGGT